MSGIAVPSPPPSRERLAPLRSLLKHRHFNAAVLLLAAAVILVDFATLLHALRGNSLWLTSTDFGLYLRTADAVRHGETAYPHVTTTAAVHHGYAYPPLLAELLLPLSAIGHSFARAVWAPICIASVAGTIALLLRGFGRQVGWHWVALAFAAVLTTYPAHNDLYHGQVDLPLMFLLTLAIWSYTRGRDATSGAIWGLSFVIKPFLGVVVLYLLWKRAYRAAAWAVGSAAALFVASFLIVLPGNHGAFRDFLKASRYDASAPFTTQLDNFSLRGFFERTLTANPFASSWVDSTLLLAGASAILAVMLAAIFVLGLGAWRRKQHAGSGVPRPLLTLVEVGFVYALAMTYGPLTEGSHLFFLLPALAGVVLIAPAMADHAGATWSGAMLVAWGVLVLLFASPVNRLSGVNSVLVGTHPHGLAVLLTARVGFALLVACCATAAALWQLRRAAAVDALELDGAPDEAASEPALSGAVPA